LTFFRVKTRCVELESHLNSPFNDLRIALLERFLLYLL
jgi:hypothetical protein